LQALEKKIATDPFLLYSLDSLFIFTARIDVSIATDSRCAQVVA
jgi:hypothetical protein